MLNINLILSKSVPKRPLNPDPMKANYLTCIFLASKEKTFLVFTPCSIKKKDLLLLRGREGCAGIMEILIIDL